ncbi:caspase-9-like [Oppia nitens]|uniref:caspase-9-like n=1 Tax=Oppia nitens TaxID=1686743 RepID=UPI0023DA496B|nr:caspase-9-like [Oppia nitens]
MEKITNRDLYFTDFIEILGTVCLTPELMTRLSEHSYFEHEMRTVVQRLSTDGEKLLFMMTSFTRSRSTCDEFIRLLRETDHTDSQSNKHVADRLQEYNTSKGNWEFRMTPNLNVTKSKAPLKGTLFYSMTKTPRGKCVIVNNVPKEVHIESDRFKDIFQKLHFDVHDWYDLTVDKIVSNLQELKSEITSDDDAFVLMIISHGSEESVLGKDGCEGLITLDVDPSNSVSKRQIKEDVIEIKKIVDIFSDSNCPQLMLRPKLFFFTCCRNNPVEELTGPQQQQQHEKSQSTLATVFTEMPKEGNLKTMDKCWSDANRDIFICYSCAEGSKSYFDIFNGITHFGQAFSHCLAQYACEETLNSIMSRTCNLMHQYFEQTGDYAPEFRGKGLRRELAFNP